MAETTQTQALPEPEATEPQGYDGNEWYEKKKRLYAAAAATGNMDDFRSITSQMAEVERSKISKHLRAALMASTAGDQESAAAQLRAVGAYVSPGTMSNVQIGPNGSFIVQNKGQSGESGYAVLPENLVDFAHMLEDLPNYNQFAFDRSIERENQQRLWGEYALKQRETESLIDLRSLQSANEQADLALKGATFDSKVAKSEADATTAMVDADVAVNTRDSKVRKSRAEADSAEIGVVQAEQNLLDQMQENKESFVTKAFETIVPANEEAEGDSLGMGGGGVDPRANSVYYTQTEDGSLVPNQSTQLAFAETVQMLKAANPEMVPEVAAGLAHALNFDPTVPFEFVGSDSSEGRPANRNVPKSATQGMEGGGAIPMGPAAAPKGWQGVIVNGQRFDLDLDDRRKLEREAMTRRALQLQEGGFEPTQFATRIAMAPEGAEVISSGRGFRSINDPRPSDGQGPEIPYQQGDRPLPEDRRDGDDPRLVATNPNNQAVPGPGGAPGAARTAPGGPQQSEQSGSPYARQEGGLPPQALPIDPGVQNTAMNPGPGRQPSPGHTMAIPAEADAPMRAQRVDARSQPRPDALPTYRGEGGRPGVPQDVAAALQSPGQQPYWGPQVTQGGRPEQLPGGTAGGPGRQAPQRPSAPGAEAVPAADRLPAGAPPSLPPAFVASLPEPAKDFLDEVTVLRANGMLGKSFLQRELWAVLPYLNGQQRQVMQAYVETIGNRAQPERRR